MKRIPELLEFLFAQALDHLRSLASSTETVAPLTVAIEHGEISNLAMLVQRLEQSGLTEVSASIRELVYLQLSEAQGMGQNYLQATTRHFPEHIDLLLPLVALLHDEQIGKLFTQLNNKQNNLLANTLYYSSLNSLRLWLPLAESLKSEYIDNMLMQKLSGWYLPRFVACASTERLPSVLRLMQHASSEALTQLIAEEDASGFNLLHYVVFYRPEHLELLLEVMKKLPAETRKSILESDNVQAGTAIKIATHHNKTHAVKLLRKAINETTPPALATAKSSIFYLKDPFCHSSGDSVEEAPNVVLN